MRFGDLLAFLSLNDALLVAALPRNDSLCLLGDEWILKPRERSIESESIVAHGRIQHELGQRQIGLLHRQHPNLGLGLPNSHVQTRIEIVSERVVSRPLDSYAKCSQCKPENRTYRFSQKFISCVMNRRTDIWTHYHLRRYLRSNQPFKLRIMSARLSAIKCFLT